MKSYIASRIRVRFVWKEETVVLSLSKHASQFCATSERRPSTFTSAPRWWLRATVLFDNAEKEPRRHPRHSRHPRHPELVSGSIFPRNPTVTRQGWTLKQVQGDEWCTQGDEWCTQGDRCCSQGVVRGVEFPSRGRSKHYRLLIALIQSPAALALPHSMTCE